MDRSDPDRWLIRQLDLDKMGTVRAVFAVAGREDFAVGADGSLLTGSAGRLMVNGPGADDWELLADWTGALPGEITRMSVSPSGRYLAIVVRES